MGGSLNISLPEEINCFQPRPQIPSQERRLGKTESSTMRKVWFCNTVDPSNVFFYHHPLKGGGCQPPLFWVQLRLCRRPLKDNKNHHVHYFPTYFMIFVMFHYFNENWPGNLRWRPTPGQLETANFLLLCIFLYVLRFRAKVAGKFVPAAHSKAIQTV